MEWSCQSMFEERVRGVFSIRSNTCDVSMSEDFLIRQDKELNIEGRMVFNICVSANKKGQMFSGFHNTNLLSRVYAIG